ncbi:LicD family protein [Butyrivibrio fibrisolvens]|uniref:LicD family protein n=1 Tax=Butyrivibrio fibrisolvens TaxID=831 RepID=UPI0003B36B80|nr:LicD family protein [Butyrivibrio fibrisolvens]
MLTIPEAFFEAEVRNDFYIPEPMKKVWAIQMTMLDLTLSTARKHNIRIWMDYGSLLGTVRHGGYIPWDDDIDICVMRKDYMKLMLILKNELPSYCNVYSFYTDDRCDQPKGFVSNRHVIDIGISEDESKLTAMYYNCPYVTGLDLYPLDYVPADPARWDYIRNLYSAAYSLALNPDQYIASGEFEDYLSQIENITGKRIKRDEHLRNSLWKFADSIAMMTDRNESRHVLWYPDSAMRKNDMRRKLSWYSNTLIKPFEMMEVPVPEGYDGVLSTCYSESYMTPRRARAAHGYPFYAEQDRKILLHKYLGKMKDVF